MRYNALHRSHSKIISHVESSSVAKSIGRESDVNFMGHNGIFEESQRRFAINIHPTSSSVSISQRNLSTELSLRAQVSLGFAFSTNCCKVVFSSSLSWWSQLQKFQVICQVITASLKKDISSCPFNLFDLLLFMRYRDSRVYGNYHYDFTTDSRLLLSVVNGKIPRKEVADHLAAGVFPTKLIFN